ncbi:MAG: HAMP domain-containing histidine kinase [Oscillospiraceae bacterium]|nr:HAMP domain-containing histidine kinase [Oscillospiraceae bacterium]
MKRAKLTEKLWAKLLAWVLAAVCALVLSASVACAIAAADLETYSYEDASELINKDLSGMAFGDGFNVVRFIRDGEEEQAEEMAKRHNAEYRLLDGEGNELWKSSGYDEDKPFLPISYEYRIVVTEEQGSDGYGYHGYYVIEHDERDEEHAPDYIVETRIDLRFEKNDAYALTARIYGLVWRLRYAAYAIAGAALLLGGACFIFLLCAARHRAGREGITRGYITPVPFDVLTAVTAAWIVAALKVIYEAAVNIEEPVLIATLFGAAVLAATLPFIGWCTSLALRVKLGKWWENTLIFRLLRLLWRGLRALGRGITFIFRSMPMTWRMALTIIAVSFLELFVYFAFDLRYDTDRFLIAWFVEKLILGGAAMYVAAMQRKLQKAGAAMAAGDLERHTDTRGLVWDFKRHGEDLNSIADGMSAAVEKQMKSERMKTDLITNVSHDIKTPLTSIINYVELLRGETSPEKREEYLEVLSRQSHRLKKLTEDLVEVSKAGSGNVEFSPARYSAAELLRQAVGEYEERLEAAGLVPVVTVPADCFIWADGTLTWRVLDNLLSNACKYAQPGTRLYIDAVPRGEMALISFKNVSRSPLNVSAEELMERFARGDASRGGEGSGLGLSIAESLTKAQGGTFAIYVDGDLFKAEIMLPPA